MSEGGLLGVDKKTADALTQQVIDDLKTINGKAIGTQLLRALAEGRHATTVEPLEYQPSSGPITGMTSTKDKALHDPFDPAKGAPATVNLRPEDVDIKALPLERLGEGHEPAPVWNPTPSHVALFHELVHAYHFINGSRVGGRVSAEQAVHPGDENVGLSEYQATGINTHDDDDTCAFKDIERFTENAYRAQCGLPLRDTYMARGYKAPEPEEQRLAL